MPWTSPRMKRSSASEAPDARWGAANSSSSIPKTTSASRMNASTARVLLGFRRRLRRRGRRWRQGAAQPSKEADAVLTNSARGGQLDAGGEARAREVGATEFGAAPAQK